VKIRKKIPAIFLCIVLAASVILNGDGVTAYAEKSTAQDSAESADSKKEKLEQERKKTQDILNNLSGLKSDAAAYIGKLDESLNTVSGEIDSLNTKIAEKETEIADTEGKLSDARNVSAQQYADMKLRIKYMYEKGNTGYLDLLFSSSDLAELLNRAEYVAKISEYDRNQLTDYENTVDDIRTQEEKLKQDKSSLEGLKDDETAKQESVKTLLADKQDELKGYDEKIGDAKDSISEYDRQIKAQEDEIKAIEAEVKRKEEEARKAAEAQAAAEAASKAAAESAAAAKGATVEAGPGGSSTAKSSAEKSTETKNIGSIKFIWPCPAGSTITSGFGSRNAPTEGASTNHMGIDISAATGSPVLAAAAGEVVVSTYSPSAGNYIMISHGGSTFTLYMHCSELNVSTGDTVKAGQTIGKVGSTGYSTGPHLHFAIRTNGQYVNPSNYVSR